MAVIMWTSAPPLPDDELELPQESPAQRDGTGSAGADGPQSENPDHPEAAIELPPQEPLTAAPIEAHVSIETPAQRDGTGFAGDEQTGWLKITRQSAAGEASSAVARYQAENEFEIQTENVDRFELDLSLLPVNATRRFILHIDGQDMLVFPKEMGRVSFGRSAEGTWEKQ